MFIQRNAIWARNTDSMDLSNNCSNSSYFKFAPVSFKWMFLRQIKNEKGLIGKRMLNICLNKLYSGKADVRKVSIFRF